MAEQVTSVPVVVRKWVSTAELAVRESSLRACESKPGACVVEFHKGTSDASLGASALPTIEKRGWVMTNHQWIVTASKEDLAAELAVKFGCPFEGSCAKVCTECKDCWVEWLDQEQE